MTSNFELHAERLATTDDTGRRITLHPADVRGRFRKLRTKVQVVLLAIFLTLPWFRIGGRQALLIDVSHREFEIFGLSLRAHNAPLLFFVFAAAAFTLFFVTSIWGRMWCGWACPQTVFIDGVFRRIERWIEGAALEQRKLAQAPWTLNKIAKRGSKWSLFVLVSLVITHSFLAYFVGTDRLAHMIASSPRENLGSFIFILVTTGVIVFDFGWFREQFCIIVCPYGRFQSVLTDRNSTFVVYDVKRGEPRATPQTKQLAKAHGASLGDCVNCYRCVQVCPVGIDIRRGVQMECISCTACMDACDEVMTKIKKPVGLIKYDSLSQPKGKMAKSSFPIWKRPRSMTYLGAALIAVTLLLVGLSASQQLSVIVMRANGELPYTYDASTDLVTNHLRLELSNQTGASQSLDFAVSGADLKDQVQLITAVHPLILTAGQAERVDLFIRVPKHFIQQGEYKTHLLIHHHAFAPTNEQTKIKTFEKSIEKDVTLVGPFI